MKMFQKKNQFSDASSEAPYTPRGTKTSRILARLRSRKFAYPGLEGAVSMDMAVQSRDSSVFQGFNANPLRGLIMRALASAGGCTVFVETGCVKTATVLCAHSFLKIPVLHCELKLMQYLIFR